MRTGKLNTTITIEQLISSVDSSGDTHEAWTPVITLRAKVEPVDGVRFLNVGELVDKVIYRVEAWGDYGYNVRILYDDMTLYPLRPPTVTRDRSQRKKYVVFVTTKV